jgi:hypothetical protein
MGVTVDNEDKISRTGTVGQTTFWFGRFLDCCERRFRSRLVALTVGWGWIVYCCSSSLDDMVDV